MNNQYAWLSTTIIDGNTQFDSTMQFDGNASAHLFWSLILGEPWIIPKTDWTRDDYYNFGDLNRVETDTEYIADILDDLGQPVTLTHVTDRTIKRIEFADSLNRIEGNIQTLADSFYVPEGWEQPKTNWQSLQEFDYRDANRLERNLMLLFGLVSTVLENMKYTGTFTCGEEDLI